MPESELARRLAALVVADVAGFSRLMEADESGTFDRLRAILSDIVEPKTEPMVPRSARVPIRQCGFRTV